MPGPAGSPYAARPWVASYPPGVPADVHLPSVPLTRLLDDATASFPRRTALTFLGTSLSYRELRDVADHLASGLARLGVRKGDRVAVLLPNCPQHVLTLFAVLRLGAVVVPVEVRSSEQELRARLADSGARVVVCLDQAYRTLLQALRGTAVVQVVVTSLADYLPVRDRLRLRLPTTGTRRARAEVLVRVDRRAGALSFVRLVRSRTAARQTPVDPETDLALLQYTGTAGRLRGTCVTHENLVSTAYLHRLWDVQGQPGQDVVLGVLPLSHLDGLVTGLIATVLLGGTLVLLPRADPEDVLEAIERWRPTVLPVAPPVVAALESDGAARARDLSSLRVCPSDAGLTADVHAHLEQLSGALVVEGHGLAKAAPSTHRNPPSALRRPGSIGLPLPGTACKVVDPQDADREVPVGETGELLVKGPQVFCGAWGQQEHDALTPDGYLRTGDLARMDEDGFFVLVEPASSEQRKTEPPSGRSDLT